MNDGVGDLQVDMRLRKVESRVVRLAIGASVALAAVLLGMALLLVRSVVSDGGVLRVQRLDLVAGSGEVVASLAVAGAGAVLKLQGSEPGQAVLVGAIAGGGGVAVAEDGEPRVLLVSTKDGGPALSASDGRGNTRLLVGLDGGGSPTIVMKDEQKRVRVQVGVLGAARIVLMGKEGQTSFVAP